MVVKLIFITFIEIIIILLLSLLYFIFGDRDLVSFTAFLALFIGLTLLNIIFWNYNIKPSTQEYILNNAVTSSPKKGYSRKPKKGYSRKPKNKRKRKK